MLAGRSRPDAGATGEDLAIINPTGTVVMVAGLDRSKSGREYFGG